MRLSLDDFTDVHQHYVSNPSFDFIDLDADGDKDLIVIAEISGEDVVHYSENIGLDSSDSNAFGPLQKNPFNLSYQMLGLERTGYDIDQDGDIDLFTAHPEFFDIQLASGENSTVYIERNYFFENKGTANAPSFGAPALMPYGLSAYYGLPKFADLDQDGDIDAYSNDILQLNNQVNNRDDQIAHVSVRAFSEAGEGRIIAGFELIGKKPQQVLIKGIGPSLTTQGVSKSLPDPVLTLFKDQQVIASNDNWQDDAKAKELTDTVFEPDHANEALLNRELAPGTYTVHLTDKQQQAGIGIVSIDTPKYAYLTAPRSETGFDQRHRSKPYC